VTKWPQHGRKNTEVLDPRTRSADEGFPVVFPSRLASFTVGIFSVPNIIDSEIPTSKSAAARLIRRKQVRFKWSLWFQKTKIVKSENVSSDDLDRLRYKDDEQSNGG